MAATTNPVLDSTVSRAIATNADFGDVRGMDLSATKRWGEWLGVSLAYAYASSRSTGADATDYVFGLSRLVPPAGVDGGGGRPRWRRCCSSSPRASRGGP